MIFWKKINLFIFVEHINSVLFETNPRSNSGRGFFYFNKQTIFKKKIMKPFENKQLEEVYNIAKGKGYKVYTFETRTKHISQIFIENTENQIGSCETYFSGIRFSTLHKPIKGSRNGTGFGGLIEGEDFNDPEDLDICFINAPYWHNGKINPKYNGFEEYKKDSYGILKYYEL